MTCGRKKTKITFGRERRRRRRRGSGGSSNKRRRRREERPRHYQISRKRFTRKSAAHLSRMVGFGVQHPSCTNPRSRHERVTRGGEVVRCVVIYLYMCACARAHLCMWKWKRGCAEKEKKREREANPRQSTRPHRDSNSIAGIAGQAISHSHVLNIDC